MVCNTYDDCSAMRAILCGLRVIERDLAMDPRYLWELARSSRTSRPHGVSCCLMSSLAATMEEDKGRRPWAKSTILKYLVARYVYKWA